MVIIYEERKSLEFCFSMEKNGIGFLFDKGKKGKEEWTKNTKSGRDRITKPNLIFSNSTDLGQLL